jgi:hypothetical protein
MVGPGGLSVVVLEMHVVLCGLESSEKRLDAGGIVVPSSSVHVRRYICTYIILYVEHCQDSKQIFRNAILNVSG